MYTNKLRTGSSLPPSVLSTSWPAMPPRMAVEGGNSYGAVAAIRLCNPQDNQYAENVKGKVGGRTREFRARGGSGRRRGWGGASRPSQRASRPRAERRGVRSASRMLLLSQRHALVSNRYPYSHTDGRLTKRRPEPGRRLPERSFRRVRPSVLQSGREVDVGLGHLCRDGDGLPACGR